MNDPVQCSPWIGALLARNAMLMALLSAIVTGGDAFKQGRAGAGIGNWRHARIFHGQVGPCPGLTHPRAPCFRVRRLRGGSGDDSSVDLEATSSFVSDSTSDSVACNGADSGISDKASAKVAEAVETVTRAVADLDAGRAKRPQPSTELKPSARDPPSQDVDETDKTDRREDAPESALSKGIQQQRAARLERKKEVDRRKSNDRLRSPILCVLGHVDTGKTKLLDKLRRTSVQQGEAGGITQQIGATFFPMDALRNGWQIDDVLRHFSAPASQGGVAKVDEKRGSLDYKLPGLLVIDTPGHESFSNLRSRGTSLCDLCILVVDLVHGLEAQTVESLQLLKQQRCPFIVALNKVDRCYGWVECPNARIQDALLQQPAHTVTELEDRWSTIKAEIAAHGLNAELFYKNRNTRKVVSVVPTSALSGEGMADLVGLAVHLTQTLLQPRLMWSSALEASVLEVKVMEGMGTTLDVVLVNGELHEGDTIVVCGLAGPITSSIRSLLTPQPMKEMRVKNELIKHKSISAAMTVKIAASGLEGAVAGTRLLRLEQNDSLDELKVTVMEDLRAVMSDLSKSGRGVHVQASTLGSLEALMDFLRNSSIPVASLNIGPVHKRDVIRAGSMVDKDANLALVLAFDVKVVPEAAEMAKQIGVTIFTGDIIYHLLDKFTKHMEDCKAKERAALAEKGVAVFPVILNIIPTNVFNKKNPFVLGVDIVEGTLKVGTPLCIPDADFLEIGKVTSIQNNHKEVKAAKVGASVAIKIEATNDEQTHLLYGRHFDHKKPLYSQISRQGVAALKKNFEDEVGAEDRRLLAKMSRLFAAGVRHW